MNFPWVKIPEEMTNGKELVSINLKSGMIAFVSIDTDLSPENPLETCDGVGQIRSLITRHSGSISSQFEFDDILSNNPDCVILSYYEHGNSLWGVRGSMDHCPDMQWDGSRTGGIWIPDQCILDSTKFPDGSDERREWMEEKAAVACKLYTLWINGECFWYNLAIHTLRKHSDNIFDQESDYRFDTPVAEDSCSGYYGWEDVSAAAKEALVA